MDPDPNPNPYPGGPKHTYGSGFATLDLIMLRSQYVLRGYKGCGLAK
jgi:hypothetical protein